MTGHLQNFLVVSVAYVVAFSLTLGFVLPLQQMLMKNVILEVSLLFLPHGIRILSFWLCGWWAAIYLIPPMYLMLLLSAHSGVILGIWSPLVSILACLIGFLSVKAIFPAQGSEGGMSDWKYLALVALVSSVLNSVGMTVLHADEPNLLLASGYLIGDMAGFFVCFFILMYAFRFVRLLSTANDHPSPKL